MHQPDDAGYQSDHKINEVEKKMDEKKIRRINELAHKYKTIGLTPEETEERDILRKEYIQAYRNNLRAQLETIKIVQPDGTVIDVKKRHDEKYGIQEEPKVVDGEC